jgi:hypothetical protein
MLPKSITKESPILEKIITPSALIILDGDIVKTYTNPDSEFCDDAATENAQAIWGLVKDKRIYHLIVPDPTTLITIEARNYRDNNFESVKKGEAIVIKTLGHRLLAHFYMNVRKNDYPVKVFDCEIKAVEWFNSLRFISE